MLWRVDTSVMFPGLERNTRPFVWYLAACSATYVVAHIIARKMKAWRPKSDVVADADLIFSLPMYSWMSFLACKGTAEVWDAGWEEHWFGSGGNSRQFTLLYAAMNLVHIPITLLKKQSTTYKALMTFHHILSISCMMTGILLNRMYFWGAFDGICEISTFCLTTLFCLKEFGGSGPVSKMLITINGVSLWLTYLVRADTTPPFPLLQRPYPPTFPKFFFSFFVYFNLFYFNLSLEETNKKRVCASGRASTPNP
uniref:TLC domain-containing protein n=2 Tax=Lotharella globosa TaxID=91324 RepID=A0A7S3YY54_9EUKA